jgi:hypothetical protein
LKIETGGLGFDLRSKFVDLTLLIRRKPCLSMRHVAENAAATISKKINASRIRRIIAFFALKRDNGLVPVPIGFVYQAQLGHSIEQAAQKLGPEVIRVRHSVGADTSGESAIFFRIILADWAINEKTLADVTGRIATTLFEELKPYENWGLIPYFTFRSNSEQVLQSDPDWV